MRILITGSRTWSSETIIADAIREVWLEHGSPSNTTVVHGGARGADHLAGNIGKRMNFEVEVFPAEWEKYGKRAGYIRNAAMVASGADICLAFIVNNSRGASMCATLAEKAGIVVRVWREEKEDNI